MRFPLHGLLVLAMMTAAAPRRAMAQPPSPELMARLADYATRFETLRTRASYRVKGQYQTLGRDGAVDSIKAMEARLDPDGDTPRLSVVSYAEDGVDKTGVAQEKARERAAKRKLEAEPKRVRIPILADEQPRYVFDQVEVDAADPSRVRIAFTPKERGSDTIEGSAWVDSRAGTLLSAGFKLNRTPVFVEYVHVTVQFGESTKLGPAVSTVTVDGKAGLLFLRKRFHAAATVWDYRLEP